MNYRYTAALLAASSCCAASSLASETNYAPRHKDIDTLIVTGTRIPTPVAESGRSISVITAKDIALRQDRLVYDSLRSVPGVHVTRSGSLGALSSVSIRGLGASQTLVVADGIVINNPATFDNQFNFANLDTSDIERIEIIRGAQATLYGSDAIGGVINIVTKDAGDGLGGSAFLEGGSFSTLRGAASLRGGNDVFSGRATLAGTTTGGFSSADSANGNREDDGYDSISFSAKGRYQASAILRFDGVLRYQDSRSEFDDFTFQPVDGDNVANSEEFHSGAFATLTTWDGQWEHRVSVTYARTRLNDETAGTPSFDTLGTRWSYEYQSSLRLIDQVTLVAGAEYDVQEAETRIGFGGNQKINTTSGYGLLQLAPYDFVTLNLGLRHDSSSDFGSETTFNGAGAIQLPLPGATLRGSYSEGFRAPTAAELSFNPNLFAEFASGWDIGLEQDIADGLVQLSLTYFSQKLRDRIAFDLAAFTFVNIQRFNTSGVEAAADVRLMSSLSLHLSYTYLDAFNVTTSTTAGNQPDHRFNADIIWQATSQLSVSAGIYYNGKEPSFGTTLDSFTLLTLRGEYALGEQWAVFARLENATDAQYQDNAGFGTAPLSAFAGVRTRF